ncbi:hypothetical protein KXD93_10330 [Mucilaginibacter sp. BJC16-A38]|uniref:tetratricopeptide repeat protein n=1 Tax=Mucilaginibacter phenanthrenivorans TaxID=1234842 RepID=UPI0021582FF4|nr:hypothetical protein [Mucilaginibacter phenanthrenivorans]MCR8558042.1 hypothetical protein [Mucilaginibacter phenanthrenivorans]
MDNTQEPIAENTPVENVCINCGNPDFVPGYPNKLCADCREKFINFPIPLWVKLFGAGIAIVMLISFIWLPGNLKTAMILSRAESNEAHHNYFTEQQELEKARKLIPGSIDVQSHLAIAAFYNGDFQTIDTMSSSLQGKKFEDTSLYNKVDYVMRQTREYFPSDTFNTIFKQYKHAIIPDTAYQRFIKQFPTDIYGIYSLAASYVNQEKYPAADSLLSRTLSIDVDFIPALTLKTMVKREINQPDSSIIYCNRLLAINNQSVFAMSSKARTLLKTGKNKEGLKLAQSGFDLDNTNPYNLATLAIALHLNNNFKQRDAIVKSAEKDSVSKSYMLYAKDIISNKIKFQTKP